MKTGELILRWISLGPQKGDTPMEQDTNAHSDSTCLAQQYKTYVADLGRIGDRKAQTCRFYVSILSALLVFLSLTGEDKPLAHIDSLAQAALSLLSIALCVVWYFNIESFRYLFKAKFDVLREMEMSLSYPCFKREAEILFNSKFKRFTVLQRYIPVLLAIPFLVILLFSIYRLFQ